MSRKSRNNKPVRAATGLRRTMLSAAVLAMMCNSAAWAQGAAAPSSASDAAVPAAGAPAAGTTPTAQGAPKPVGANGTVQQDTVVVTGTRTGTKASQSLTP